MKVNKKLARWNDLLDKLTVDARTLSDETARPDALTSVADAYWPLSQTRARELFSSALESALQIQAEQSRNSAVTRVISSAAKRDPDLANKLTATLLDRKSRNDSALKASLDLLESNPKASEAIAIAASSVGVTADSVWFIFQLHKRDPAAADRVYSAYLRNVNSSSLNRLLWLAGYPFGYGEAFGGATDPLQFTGFSGFDVGAFRTNPVLAREFLNLTDQAITVTLNIANTQPDGGEAMLSLVFFAVTYLLPEAERYHPDLHGRWMALKNETGQRINPSRREALLRKIARILGDRERASNSTAGEDDASAETLEQAEKLASGCERNAIYAKAAFQLSYKTTFKEALSVAEKIDALELRNNVVQFVYYDMSLAGTRPDSSVTLDDALRFANKVEAPELHALLLIKIASVAATSGERAEAKQLLFDATKLAERVSKISVRVAILLAIEKHLPESETDTRFELLRDAITTLNANGDKTRIDQLSIQRRVDFGCETNKPIWHGESVGRFNLIDHIVRFSNAREDEAVQLALDLDPGLNRIRTLAAIAGSAINRIAAKPQDGSLLRRQTPAERIPSVRGVQTEGF